MEPRKRMDKRTATRIVEKALTKEERDAVNVAVNDAWQMIGSDVLAVDRNMKNKYIVEILLDGGYHTEPCFPSKELFQKFRAIDFEATRKWIEANNTFN